MLRQVLQAQPDAHAAVCCGLRAAWHRRCSPSFSLSPPAAQSLDSLHAVCKIRQACGAGVSA